MKHKHNQLRLVRFELRKTILSPWLLIFLVVLLCMNAWMLTRQYNSMVSEWSEYGDVYDELYEEYHGEITAEKVSSLMKIYSPLAAKNETNSLSYEYDPDAYTYCEADDFDFFDDLFYSPMSYCYLYQNTAVTITKDASELSEFYEEFGNTYEVEKNLKIASAFSGRKVTSFEDSWGVRVLFKYDYSSFLVLLLCVFGLCSIFVVEKESEMYMLLSTTERGGASTVVAKLTAALIFTVSVSVIFWVEDFLVIYFLAGKWDILTCPIYSVFFFELSPLTMTVGQYLIFAAAVKTLGIICFGCIIVFVSCLSRNVLSSFITSTAVILALSLLLEVSGTSAALKWFNPMELIRVRNLVHEDVFVNVFGHAVRLYVFVIAGILLTIVVISSAILFLNRSKYRKSAPRNKSLRGRIKREGVAADVQV